MYLDIVPDVMTLTAKRISFFSIPLFYFRYVMYLLYKVCLLKCYIDLSLFIKPGLCQEVVKFPAMC